MESRVLGLGKNTAPLEIVAFHPVYGCVMHSSPCLASNAFL